MSEIARSLTTGIAGGPPPETLIISNPEFATLAGPVFQRASSDGAPIITVPMGNTAYSITLPALRRQLGIAAASADGRMLDKIAEALDFVSVLRAGDSLPAEVKTGDASWSAEPAHLRRASTRLRLRLVAWHRHGKVDPGPKGDAILDRLERDPDLPHLILAAIRRTQCEPGLPDGPEIVARLEAISWELSFIEALRERLHDRLAAIAGAIDTATHGLRNDRQHGDMRLQVRRLLRAAIAQVAQRLNQLDATCANVVAMVRDPASCRAIIRADRDWLYRTKRKLVPLFSAWEGAPDGMDDQFWPRMATTYRTLAPLFMATQEWRRGGMNRG